MGQSLLSKRIGQFTPEGRAWPRSHVTPSLKDNWLLGRGIATEEGAFPRGLREGQGGTKRGWALRVMAAPWPRVHLYRSLGPVTKESCRYRCPIPPVAPGDRESQCCSRAALLWERPWGRGYGGEGSPRAGHVCEGGEQRLEPGAERQDWGSGRFLKGAW